MVDPGRYIIGGLIFGCRSFVGILRVILSSVLIADLKIESLKYILLIISDGGKQWVGMSFPSRSARASTPFLIIFLWTID